jgi:hypothetical protein
MPRHGVLLGLKALKEYSPREGSRSISLIDGGYRQTSNTLIRIREFHIDYVAHAHGLLVNFGS